MSMLCELRERRKKARKGAEAHREDAEGRDAGEDTHGTGDTLLEHPGD